MNKKLVKILFPFLVLTLVFSLIGCGEEEPVEDNGETEEEAVVEEFPQRTVNIVVPWPAGGRTDTYMRGLAPLVEDELDISVIVSNHAGASSVRGARAVLDEEPDGHTLLALSGGTMAFKVAREPALPVDEFDPVVTYVHQPYFIATHADSPYETFEDLVEAAEENPGEINMGDTGSAVDDNLYMLEIMDQLDIEMNQVHHAGDSPLIENLVSEDLDAGIGVISGLKPHVDEGTIRLLAVGSQERHPDYPDVPTLQEVGVDLVADYFGLIAAPQGTPDEAMDILDEAFKNAIEHQDFQELMDDLNSNAVYWDRHESSEAMEEAIERDVERAKKFGLDE